MKQPTTLSNAKQGMLCNPFMNNAPLIYTYVHRYTDTEIHGHIFSLPIIKFLKIIKSSKMWSSMSTLTCFSVGKTIPVLFS